MSHTADLLLASTSPRRRELLAQIGVRFDVLRLDVPEERAPDEAPAAYVQRLALAKAQAGSRLRPELPVLGADTTVVCHGQVLEKPRHRAHGLAMLAQLSGQCHEVLTAVALCQGQLQASCVVTTQVHFRPISIAEAERYWDSEEPADKAGGYAIQGLGAVFVTAIEGSYSNVVGLPLAQTAELLQTFSIPVWSLRHD